MSIKTSITVLVFIVFNVLNINAQKDHVLFTLDGKDVYSSEFSKIYEKNLAIVNDDSQKDIDNYLDLYVNYRLKLQEAYDLKMDTVKSYIAEYNKYKNQLIEPYLKDDNKQKDLIKEAYGRLKKEVNASHILVRMKENASPGDTLKAYKKIAAARKQILAGATFESVAKKVSEDPSVKDNGGSLGFFSVFQMVYPFETMAFTTPVGTVSEVFKTKFGYHIVKVEDIRDSQGEVQVAHIMLKGDSEENIAKINNIKQQLNEGGDFAALAKSYSTDLATSMKGGILPKFSSSKMVKSFSDVAFSMKEIGEISEPFKTRYGWHIVKLVEKFPVGTFEDMEEEMAKKVKQGQRAKLIGRSVIDRLLKEYTIDVDNKVVGSFETASDASSSTNEVEVNLEKTILKIQDKEIAAEAFSNYYNFKKKVPLKTAFQEFKEKEVIEYYKEKLPSVYPELDQTLREYREGLLLFDLMQNQIWEKAEQDSIGLVNFFDKNKSKYQWRERVRAKIITCDKNENATKAIELLQNNTSIEEIKKQLAEDGIVDIKEGAFEKTNAIFPTAFNFNKGVSDVIAVDKQFMVVAVEETLPAQAKELTETRGRVISDFQDYIEKNWVAELQNRYPVTISKKALKKLKRKYQ